MVAAKAWPRAALDVSFIVLALSQEEICPLPYHLITFPLSPIYFTLLEIIDAYSISFSIISLTNVSAILEMNLHDIWQQIYMFFNWLLLKNDVFPC
jgi:hypothetical protein